MDREADLDDGQPTGLDGDTIADSDALGNVVAGWIQQDAEPAERQREIDDLVWIVHGLADDQVWDLVQRVLGLIDRRHDDLALMIARRAFDAGHRLVPEDSQPAANDGELPVLDERILVDSTRLAKAIDKVLRSDEGLRDLSTVIFRSWARARRDLDDESWKRILGIEELLSDRSAIAQEILVAWAFDAGLRAARTGADR